MNEEKNAGVEMKKRHEKMFKDYFAEQLKHCSLEKAERRTAEFKKVTYNMLFAFCIELSRKSNLLTAEGMKYIDEKVARDNPHLKKYLKEAKHLLEKECKKNE